MNMKTLKLRIMTTLLLGGLLSTGPGQATTFTPLTLVQQAKKADVIVQATIGVPTTVTEGSQVYAVYPLKVSETLAGDAATLPQTVGSQGGGGPALFILSGIEGAPTFQSGQDVVLLLYKGRLDSPLVGYNQGAYLIANGQVSVLNAPLASPQGPGGTVRQPLTPLAAPQPAASASTGTPSQPTASPVSPGVNIAPVVNAAPGTPIAAAPAGTAVATLPPGNPAPNLALPVPSAPGGPAPVPPVPVLTTVPSAEAQAVPATSGTPAVAAPGVPSSAAVVPSQSQDVPVPAATLSTAAAPAGVLGTIRTPAELKAAIVAARAGQ